MRILLACPVNEDSDIFELHLKHVRKLHKPKNCILDKMYYFHNCPDLQNLLQDNEMSLFYESKTDYKKTENTHHWNIGNFSDVIYMKNELLNIARERDYDYIFYVDSDLILHPDTLLDLFNARVGMIANIFWTKWQLNTPELPNCWHMDHYEIYEFDFEKWKNEKKYFQVGMTGACTLISRKYFQHEVINWKPIYNSSISYWEDRAFCMRVAMLGFPIYVSTKNPAIHLYRRSEYEKFVKNGGIYE